VRCASRIVRDQVRCKGAKAPALANPTRPAPDRPFEKDQITPKKKGGGASAAAGLLRGSRRGDRVDTIDDNASSIKRGNLRNVRDTLATSVRKTRILHRRVPHRNKKGTRREHSADRG